MVLHAGFVRGRGYDYYYYYYYYQLMIGFVNIRSGTSWGH